MVCIYCSHKTKVVNSRSSKSINQTWRRRQCLNCHSTFTSRELPDLAISMRVKYPSGALEPFYRDRIFVDIYRSLSHRKTALNDASALTDTIIDWVLAQKSPIITSKRIKQLCLKVLSNFDQASAVFYESHFIDKE